MIGTTAVVAKIPQPIVDILVKHLDKTWIFIFLILLFCAIIIAVLLLKGKLLLKLPWGAEVDISGSNNSSKNVKYYIEKLKKMGCKIKSDKVLISNQVIIQYIKKYMSDKKVYLLGTDYLKADFINANIEIVEDDPGLVIVGFDTTLEYKRLSKACDFIRNNVPVFAVNPDFNCPTETGFIPDCGSIFGKPSHYTLQYILDYTKLKDFEIAYVGDRLYTDIALGNNNKMITILVLTGETKKEDLINSTIKPNLVFESLKEIKSTLDEIY